MCGIAGAIALWDYIQNIENGNVSLVKYRDRLAYMALQVLRNNENRWGQGFGMTFLWKDFWKTEKFWDIRGKEIRKKISEVIDSVFAAIWHARYATSSVDKDVSLDKNLPYVSDEISEFDEDRTFSFSFNWNIANSLEIKKRLEKKWQDAWVDRKFKYENYDSEILKYLIIDYLESGYYDLRNIVEEINKEIDGCCNLAILMKDGRFIASIDKHEFRPLNWWIKDGIFYFSSEEHWLDAIGIDIIHKISAGETVEVIDWQIYEWKMRITVDPRPCAMEYIYFSNPLSRLHNGEAIQKWRYRIGQTMAELETLDIEENPDEYVIVWVPDGGTLYAQWYAEFFWKKPLNALLKDADVGRTFTASDEEREVKLLKKYLSAFEGKVQWKKLVLLDDSLVRSNTLRRLIPFILEKLKPSEIHIRICSPTLNGHCPYALNIQWISELFAPKFVKNPADVTDEENIAMAKNLWVNSIHFLSQADLKFEMIRVWVKAACMACMDGNYPTACGQAEHDRQLAEVTVKEFIMS